MRPRLRLFTGDDETIAVADPAISMSFGELTQIISHASRHHRTWLHDFDTDTVQVPSDLYEVLTAYVRMRPGA